MVLCIKQLYFGRKTMEKSIAKSADNPPNDSDDGELWDLSEDEFDCSSSTSSVMGGSSKQVAGIDLSSKAKQKEGMDGDAMDDDDEDQICDKKQNAIGRAKSIAGKTFACINTTTKTMEEALNNVPMSKCKVDRSKIAGDGLFACKRTHNGQILAVLSSPKSQHEIQNGQDPPAGCVQVHRDADKTTYQDWQRDKSDPRNIGGFANAGNNLKANCIIFRVTKQEELHDGNFIPRYATLLVGIERIEAEDEIFAIYDNTPNNSAFFEAEKQASSSTKQVDQVDKADAGFAGAPEAGNSVQSAGEACGANHVSGAGGTKRERGIDAFETRFGTELYLLKQIVTKHHASAAQFSMTAQRCLFTGGRVERKKNGKHYEPQKVLVASREDEIEVHFSKDLIDLIGFCKKHKIFFHPGADEDWLLAKDKTGKWLVVVEESEIISEVKDCWLNNLISLFGVGAPWEDMFDDFYDRFLHECAEFGKHKRSKKRISIDCLRFIPLCVQRCQFFENAFHASGLKQQSNLKFLGHSEVTSRMHNHASKKCICYGVT